MKPMRFKRINSSSCFSESHNKCHHPNCGPVLCYVPCIYSFSRSLSIFINNFCQNNVTIQVYLIVPSPMAVHHYKAEKTSCWGKHSCRVKPKATMCLRWMGSTIHENSSD